MSHTLPTPDGKVARLLKEAVALHHAGNLEGAELAYRKVLKAFPREPDSLHLLGVVRTQRGDPQDGVALIKRALSIRDDFPDAHVNLALALWQHLGDPQAAERHVRRALTYKRTPQIYCHLGNILRERGQHEDALSAYRAAMECDPRSPDGYVMYARALRRTSDPQAMLSVAQAGLALSPQHPTLQLLASEAYFALGRLQEGWRAYRWRFKSLENRAVSQTYSLPTWEGEDLAGRSLLIWTEQGPGDEIMYASMFADAIAAAKRCAIQCSPRLAPLMRRSFPAADIFDCVLTADELRGFDIQSPAASLGEWLRPTLGAFPRRESYLEVDKGVRDRLRAKYLADPSRPLVVGIAWRSVNTESAPDKSLSLLEWGPILQVPGVAFVNLQYGDTDLEIQEAMKGFGVQILQDRSVDPLRDIDGYAAQVAAMDLVVTSSNTAAHVAGAVGIPALCMLPMSLAHGRRWYWFAQQPECPWYRRVRLFNQRREGQWLDVIRDVGLALVDEAAARGVAVASHLRAMAQAFARIQRSEDAHAYYMRLAAETGLAAQAFFSAAELRTAALDAEGAFALLDKAIAADPGFWPAHNSKGSILGRLNRFDDAIAAYRAGLAQNAHVPQLHNNLGTALLRLGRSREALHHYEEAGRLGTALDAATRDSIAINHAAALDSLGRIDEAIAILDDIISRNPEDVDSHYNRSRGYLAAGRFKEGWPEFEWRLKRPGANVRYDKFPHLKRWDGEDLSGKRALIWTEQGIGDEILTASMVPDAIQAAAHVTILCSPRLVPLFRRSFPTATVDERREPLPKSARDPRLSFQMSTSDLGRAFRPNFQSFPSRRQFLVADGARQQALRKKYARVRPGALLVGISWSSHGNREMGWLKSNRLEAWKPILETRGVIFINLQYGDCTEELAHVRERLGIDVVNDPEIDSLKDMDGFAAQVATMDLVVSTSNSAVHAAGGLGVPTWVLAPEGRGRHWYWFKDRDVSPWYPSLRFIRPGGENDWDAAIARCAAELSAWQYSHGKGELT